MTKLSINDLTNRLLNENENEKRFFTKTFIIIPWKQIKTYD